MKIFQTLEECPFKTSAITVGTFDGVHKGHQKVLETLKSKSPFTTVITFVNHPSNVLRPNEPVPLLCTLDHRVRLIEKQGIDQLLLLTFTKELSQQSAENFLAQVGQYCPFENLVLGHDATLGKDKRGDRFEMQALAKKKGFTFDYVDELKIEGLKVSSSAIRQLIHGGKLDEASKLLGRPFSIYGNKVPGHGFGKRIGYPTLNIPVEGLCLPPFGVYAVKVNNQGNSYKGAANLGLAPTLRQDNKPLLEVHLIEETKPLIGPIEVVFQKYLRPEKRFATVEELKQQIAKDIQAIEQIT